MPTRQYIFEFIVIDKDGKTDHGETYINALDMEDAKAQAQAYLDYFYPNHRGVQRFRVREA